MSDYTPEQWSALKQDRRQEKIIKEGSRINRALIRRAQKLKLPLEALMTAGPALLPNQRRASPATRAHVIRFFLKLRKLVGTKDAPPAGE